MKKINFNQPITNLEGKPMMQGKDKMMVNKIVANLLSISKPYKQDKAIRQFDIALKIYNANGVLEIDDEDIAMIKAILNKADTSTLVQGQISKILDKGEEVKEENSKKKK